MRIAPTPRAVPLLAAAAAFLLAGCSSSTPDADGPSAAPSTVTSPSATARPSDVTSTTSPVGTRPVLNVDVNYTYTLSTSCFCAEAGVPVEVTVIGGKVVDAVYARTGYGHKARESAGRWTRLSLGDIAERIDAARDSDAYRVDVTWPEGQGYPSKVFIDQSKLAVDEEIGYTIRNVHTLQLAQGGPLEEAAPPSFTVPIGDPSTPTEW